MSTFQNKKWVIYIALIVLSLAAASTSYGQLMAEYSSARALAMGNMGATQVDAMSYRVNPASLALYAGPDEITLSLAPYSWSTEFLGGYESWSTGGAVGFGGDRAGLLGGLNFGVGYWFNELSRGSFYWTNEFGDLLGVLKPAANSHNLALSVAHVGKVRVGFGTTLKLLHDEAIGYADGLYTASSFAADFGVILAYPILPGGTDLVAQPISGWSVTPSLGFSASNLFAEFEYDELLDKWKPVQDIRYGFSIEFANDDRGRRELSLLLEAEYEKQTWDGRYDINISHYGGELGFYELLYARYGRLKYEDADESQETYGFAVSTRGLNNLFTRHGGNYQEMEPEGWWHKVAVEFSYAKFSDDGPTWFQGMNLYQFDLILAL